MSKENIEIDLDELLAEARYEGQCVGIEPYFPKPTDKDPEAKRKGFIAITAIASYKINDILLYEGADGKPHVMIFKLKHFLKACGFNSGGKRNFNIGASDYEELLSKIRMIAIGKKYKADVIISQGRFNNIKDYALSDAEIPPAMTGVPAEEPEEQPEVNEEKVEESVDVSEM